MKYKVGDRVQIKSLDWYNENKNEFGNVKCSLNCSLTKSMSIHCGSIQTIESVVDGGMYWMKENPFNWTDEMIEGLVEEETYDFLKTDKPNRPSLNDFMDMLNNEIKLPDGYIFKDENGNEILTSKIILEKKKKEYPKTLDECRAILGMMSKYGAFNYKANLITTFMSLLICRDAYWKIAGEEMGLGEPWKPDWSDCEKIKYIIGGYGGEIGKGQSHNIHITLAFPTPEMRDAFKENFDPDIVFCKEFL